MTKESEQIKWVGWAGTERAGKPHPARTALLIHKNTHCPVRGGSLILDHCLDGPSNFQLFESFSRSLFMMDLHTSVQIS